MSKSRTNSHPSRSASRWTDRERDRLWQLRNQNLELSWKQFHLMNYFPNRTQESLYHEFRDLKRKSQEKRMIARDKRIASPNRLRRPPPLAPPESAEGNRTKRTRLDEEESSDEGDIQVNGVADTLSPHRTSTSAAESRQIKRIARPTSVARQPAASKDAAMMPGRSTNVLGTTLSRDNPPPHQVSPQRDPVVSTITPESAASRLPAPGITSQSQVAQPSILTNDVPPPASSKVISPPTEVPVPASIAGAFQGLEIWVHSLIQAEVNPLRKQFEAVVADKADLMEENLKMRAQIRQLTASMEPLKKFHQNWQQIQNVMKDVEL